eukprot:gene14892-15029_t
MFLVAVSVLALKRKLSFPAIEERCHFAESLGADLTLDPSAPGGGPGRNPADVVDLAHDLGAKRVHSIAGWRSFGVDRAIWIAVNNAARGAWPCCNARYPAGTFYS